MLKRQVKKSIWLGFSNKAQYAFVENIAKSAFL